MIMNGAVHNDGSPPMFFNHSFDGCDIMSCIIDLSGIINSV
jgi:hypothetical protein